jgi:formylglycine-generating enzyme required for sulfatase activity
MTRPARAGRTGTEAMSPLPGIILAAAAGMVALAVGLANVPSPPDATELVAVAPGAVSYRASGEYQRDGVPVNAPLLKVVFDRPLTVMKRQVSRAEYDACVAAGVCKASGSPALPGSDSLPAVEVDWADASAYAAWLSQTTGHRYRLPTDAEWAYAAGERFRDDALPGDGDAGDPSKRWLAAYDAEAARGDDFSPEPRAFGGFGANRNGLLDIAGNVWEWTDTCYVRHASYTSGRDTATDNCGVRVVAGSHRSYMSDFIRRPRGGACSAGRPPSNLGIRLVREEDGGFFWRLFAAARRLLG